MKKNKLKKENHHGFTLAELLVTITILGIILVIAIPKVINLQNDNKETKYVKYSEAIIASGKLYTDSYSKDMFGNNSSGCYDIPYSELKAKNLLKDINIDNAKCDTYAEDGVTPLTYVKVLKSNDNYLYEVSIKCVDKDNPSKVLYEKTIDGTGVCDGTTIDEEGPTITFSPNGKTWYNGKKSGTNDPDVVTVSLRDEYGLKENATIQYAWLKDGESESSLTYKSKSFGNKRYEGTTSSPLVLTLEVPQTSGEYTLIIKTDAVRDVNGMFMDETTVKSNKFQIDNTKPTITNKTIDKDGVWTNGPVNITASGTDAHSGVTKIYYTYSNSNDPSGLKDNWKETTPTGKDLNVSGIWTSERESNIYVIAEDAAGNQSAITLVGKIMIDKTKPTITETTNSSNGNWTNGNVMITAKAKDTKSGIKQIYYTYQATDTATKNNDWTTNNIASVSGTWSTARNSEVFIIAVDNAGNYSDFKSAGNVKIDKTAPTIDGISNPSNGNATATAFALTLTGHDNTGGSGIRKWRYSWDNSTWNDYSNSNKSPFTTTNFSAKRNQNVYISLCDIAGNCSDSSTTKIHIVNECDSDYVTISEYGNWTACTKVCGGGTQTRTNTLKSTLTGNSCGTSEESQACGTTDCCSSTTTSCGSYGACDVTCGTGTKTRICQSISAIDSSVPCGSSYQDSTSCDTGVTCGPPSHTHKTGVLGTSLHTCNYELSCGTKHTKAYYGYCGICWNYGIIYRTNKEGASFYCPGSHRDGCKNGGILYSTEVPD